MKPALSRVSTVSLPSLAPNSMPTANASSDVVTARMTSTSFITCTGLKKCRPRNCSGRDVATAWSIKQRRGVGGKERLGLDQLVELPPHLELEPEVLGDGLDHEVGLGEV